MPKISESRRLDRRREIADAARRCFVTKGFDGTSMADIVHEVGLSAGAIYVHYENKQDLIRQVVTDALTERAGEMAELTARRPVPHPVEVLSELVAEAQGRDYAALRIHAWSACLREPEFEGIFDGFQELRHAHFTEYAHAWLLQEGFAEAEAAQRADSVATIIVGLFQGFLLQLALTPAQTVRSLVEAARWIDFAPPREHIA